MHYSIDTVNVDGVEVFFRSAGSVTSPVILLLHGYPSSSHQFRNLIPLLASKYRVIAPDFPGFGFTVAPSSYTYSFASLATTLGGFIDALSIEKFAMYIFDYGAPVGLRLALENPTAITAIITQNGNAYEEGLGRAWKPIQDWWASGSRQGDHAESVRKAVLNVEAKKWQYVTGSPTPDRIRQNAGLLTLRF